MFGPLFFDVIFECVFALLSPRFFEAPNLKNRALASTGAQFSLFHQFPTRTLKSSILGAFWEPFGSLLAPIWPPWRLLGLPGASLELPGPLFLEIVFRWIFLYIFLKPFWCPNPSKMAGGPPLKQSPSLPSSDLYEQGPESSAAPSHAELNPHKTSPTSLQQQEQKPTKNPTRNLPETYQDHSRNLPGAYQEPTRNLPGTCQGPTGNLPGTCQKPTRNLPGTYEGPTGNTKYLPGTYQEPSRNLPGTYQEPTRN